MTDRGTNWHPANADAYDADGNLRDLDDEEVLHHAAKPEAANHPDSAVNLLEAEGSAESPPGQV